MQIAEARVGTGPAPTRQGCNQVGKAGDPDVPGPADGAEADERITCNAAFPLLGFHSQQQFNHVRRQLERARNRDTGVLVAMPDFESIEERLGPAERSRREKEFLHGHILVVPEWGGIKWPSGSWTYSRKMCEAIRDRGVAGLDLGG